MGLAELKVAEDWPVRDASYHPVQWSDPPAKRGDLRLEMEFEKQAKKKQHDRGLMTRPLRI